MTYGDDVIAGREELPNTQGVPKARPGPRVAGKSTRKGRERKKITVTASQPRGG